MHEKHIKFIATEDYYNLCDEFPVPIKVNIPQWFKKLQHTTKKMTVKGCMPFLDTLTTGYLLKLPMDIELRHNVINKTEEGEIRKDSFINCPIKTNLWSVGINLNHVKEGEPAPDVHGTQQLEGSPQLQKNKNFPFYKILNPWKIVTPPGYSCLFLPPLNNTDDRFEIIPGIVDTDSFKEEVNFPFIINGYKHPVLETILKKGTPYVQVIPFKRESWKMKLETRKRESSLASKLVYPLNLIHSYKSRFWSKKTFK